MELSAHPSLESMLLTHLYTFKKKKKEMEYFDILWGLYITEEILSYFIQPRGNKGGHQSTQTEKYCTQKEWCSSFPPKTPNYSSDFSTTILLFVSEPESSVSWHNRLQRGTTKCWLVDPWPPNPSKTSDMNHNLGDFTPQTHVGLLHNSSWEGLHAWLSYLEFCRADWEPLGTETPPLSVTMIRWALYFSLMVWNT